MQRAAIVAVSIFLILSFNSTQAGPYNPNFTATIVVDGFDPDGAGQQGIYGEHDNKPLLNNIADLIGLTTTNQNGPILEPNVVAAPTYYGDTAPDYYNTGDLADIDFVTRQWGGGIPRYALIVAKYAKRIMRESGAQQINFVSGSMGTLITRYMLEKNLEGLVSSGKVARWLSLEGVMSGNWIASQGIITDIWDAVETLPIDADHMDYNWVERNINSPRQHLSNASMSSILIGQQASTDDSDNSHALTILMQLAGDYQPNDGVQGVEDMYFHFVTPESRFLGQNPTLNYIHTTHLGLKKNTGVWAEVATFLTSNLRVRATLTNVTVNNLHERIRWWSFNKNAEIVFESEVHSPLIASEWQVTSPISQRSLAGGVVPIHYFRKNRRTRAINQVVFDDFIHSNETELQITLSATEIDADERYDVYEDWRRSYDRMSGAVVTVPVNRDGTYHIVTSDWQGDLKIEVLGYPFAALSNQSKASVDSLF